MTRGAAAAMSASERAILERAAQSLPLRETLELAARLVEDSVAGCCCILRVGADAFSMVACTGAPARLASFYAATTLDPEADPCSLAVRSGKPVGVADSGRLARWYASDWARAMAADGFVSACAIPIMTGDGQSLGVLVLHRSERALAGDDEMPILERVGGFVRIALERAKVDDALLAQQDELRRALDHLTQAQRLSHTGSFTTDVEADDHVWSDELYRVLEFDPGTKVRLHSFRALIHPDDLAGFDAGFRRALAQGTHFDLGFRIVTPRGTAKHLHAVSHFGESAGGRRFVVGSIQDVTASRNAEETLRARESELQRAMAQLAEGQRLSATGSFTSDIQLDRHSWSAEFYRIFELDPTMAPNIQGVRALIHPDDLELFDSEIRRGMAGCEADFVFRIVTAAGRMKHLRGVAHLMEHVGGRPIFMGTVQDISERKAAEEARDRARSELAHVARAAALSALTASIAHEVNQPLAGIITNASTCLRMLAATPSDIDGAKATARRTLRDADRASKVIKRLRGLFAGEPMRKDRVDLNEAVREVLSLAAAELQKGRVIVYTDLNEDLPGVFGDRVQLQQVILNLVLNASEAMHAVDYRTRRLAIVTSREDAEAALAVSDTGIGVPADQLDQLFRAFYTTKSHGMGIGLFVSRSIVEAHGGSLAATRNHGVGLTLSVRLPAVN